MKTISIDIINDKVMILLRELERLEFIKMNEGETKHHHWGKYKGAMTQQPIEEVDQQLNTLREG